MQVASCSSVSTSAGLQHCCRPLPANCEPCNATALVVVRCGPFRRREVEAQGDCLPAGRERQDSAECWVAVASQEFSRQLLEDMPLQKDRRPLPPGKAAMAAMAPRMWREVQELLRGLGVGEPEQEPLFMQAGPACLRGFMGSRGSEAQGLLMSAGGPRIETSACAEQVCCMVMQLFWQGPEIKDTSHGKQSLLAGRAAHAYGHNIGSGLHCAAA